MDIQVDNQTRQSHRKSSKQESTSLVGRFHRRITRKQHIACNVWRYVVTNSTASKIKAHRSRMTKLLPGVFTKGLQLLPSPFLKFSPSIFNVVMGYIFSSFPYPLSGRDVKMTGSIQVIIHAILPIYH